MNKRELKFRLWSKSENEYINPNILEVWDSSGKLEPYMYIKTGTLNPVYIDVENYVIQQYTGLKDKNGKEIYEGDIIKGQLNFEKTLNMDDKKIGKVEYHPSGFFDVIGKNFSNFLFAIEDREIIGNIFENSELLSNQH